MLLFALNASRTIGEQIADSLELPLADHEEREFSDGENKTRPLTRVRNQPVTIIHSLYADGQQTINDKFCRLLFFIGAVKDAGAATVCVAIPYLAYARKDRRTKFQDPLSQRYVLQLLESMGATSLITLDVHNPAAFENAARIAVLHLQALDLLCQRIDLTTQGEDLVIVSPDTGGVKRATEFIDNLSRRRGISIPLAHVDKRRSQDKISGAGLTGEVRGRTAVIVDDMISSGTTARRAIEQIHRQGARRIVVAASHCLNRQSAERLLDETPLQQLLTTNTVDMTEDLSDPRADNISTAQTTPSQPRLETLSVAHLIADAIADIHS